MHDLLSFGKRKVPGGSVDLIGTKSIDSPLAPHTFRTPGTLEMTARRGPTMRTTVSLCALT
jgi:hypothetical protein